MNEIVNNLNPVQKLLDTMTRETSHQRRATDSKAAAGNNAPIRLDLAAAELQPQITLAVDDLLIHLDRVHGIVTLACTDPSLDQWCVKIFETELAIPYKEVNHV